MGGCKSKTILLIKCPKCNNGFCAKHRHADVHQCPKDITENKENDNGEEQMEDNRWLFVKTQLCKKWNAKIVNTLQSQIIYEEFDFDDLIEDLDDFDDNESALLDFLIDKYEWKDSMALNFHKDIVNALQNAPNLNLSDDDGNDFEDIYEYDDNQKDTQVTQLKTKNNINIIQWIYNELKPYITDAQSMNIINKAIEIIMNDETDDQMQYQLWELLGKNSAPMFLVKKLRSDRKRIRGEIIKLHDS